jgi:site-specific DNA-methyltransferase (adenine-specific)
LFRGTIVWNKGALGKHSTAWGSWKSPRNPILRGEHEYILVFSKNRQEREQCSRSTITSEEFKEYTKSVWTFQTASATKIGHPAPFPVELPYRCIQLYTYEHEIVLDPFIGSGQTAIACISTNRYYVGYEKNEKYFKLINERLKDHVKEETLW